MDAPALDDATFLTAVRSATALRAFVLRWSTSGWGVVAMPLAEVPARLYPRRDALLAAWARLADVRRADAGTLRDVILVLVESQPEAAVTASEPPPLEALDPPPPGHRPTARHPRAYRGTKDRPAKRAAAAPLDLRGVLLDPRAAGEVRRRLARFDGAAFAALVALGLDPLALEAAFAEPDAHLGYHFGGGAERRVFPLRFGEELVPALRGRPWRVVEEVLLLHRRLDLEAWFDERAAFVRLFARAPAQALAWMRLAAELPAPAAERAAVAIVDSGAAARDPAPLAACVARLGLSGERLAERWPLLCRAVADGVDLDYVAWGLGHAEAASAPRELTLGGTPRGWDAGAMDALLARLAEVGGHEREPLTVWHAIGREPALAGLFASLAGVALAPPALAALMRLLVLHSWPAEDEAPLSALLARRDELVALFAATPASHLDKLVVLLSDTFQYWADVAHLDAVWPDVVALARTHCAAGAPTAPAESFALQRLVDPDPADRARLREAGPASWRALEEMNATRNEIRLCDVGLQAIRLELGRFVVDAFVEAPRPLLRAARALGVLERARARLVVRAVARQPLFATRLASAPLPELLATLDALPAAVREAHNPVPRRLREHLTGGAPLRPGQLARARDAVAAGLVALRCAFLDHEAARLASEPLAAPAESEAARVAVAIAAAAEANRRAFRRLVRAYFAGERDWAEVHPESRRWYARHPRLDAALWRAGVVEVVEVEGHGRLTLAVEPDPLEVVRLGEYVRSCLGPGGAFAFSAAAVALDVNKRVIYARDGGGRVVGRQLVAISEDERLVCFDVYPVAASRALQSAFAAYDRALAARLGLPVLVPPGPDDEDAVIARVLSRDSYEETPWDLVVRDRAGA